MAKGTKWYAKSGIENFNPGGPRNNLGNKGYKGPKITDEMRQAIIRRLDGKKGGGRKNLPVGGMTPIGGGGGFNLPGSNNIPRTQRKTKRMMARGTKWYK